MQASTRAVLVGSLASFAMAQSSPSPTSTGMGTTSTLAMPFFVPWATSSIGGSVVSIDSSVGVFALTCLDASGCPNPPTATYTFGQSTFDFKYTSSGGDQLDWNCPVTGTDSVTCPLTADGSTVTRTEPLTALIDSASTSNGIPQAVTVTAGWEKAASTSSGSTSGSGSGSSMPSQTGSSTTSMASSAAGSSSSAASSAHTTAGAERLIAGSGAIGAMAILAGAILA